MSVRVLLVFSSSELGGAERSLTRMALGGGAGGYQLATLDGEGPWVDWVRGQGHEPQVFGARSGRHGRFGWAALWALVRHVRAHRIPIVYACGARACLMLRALRPFMPGVRLVQGVRWNPDSQSRLDRFFRATERHFQRGIDLYIANSAAAAETLKRMCGVDGKRIRVIYNGLEAVPAEPAVPDRASPRVLTVANLSERKGYFEYLDVIRHVLARVPTARFTFVGRDDMQARLQAEIERQGLGERIEYAGFQRDVAPYFHRASLFVLPSLRNEGCPTSILEALSHSVPVVAYAIDGIPELVRSGADGLLVPLGDQAGMAEAIVRLLQDPETAAAFGQRGRQKVAEGFTLTKCASLHQQAWHELLAADLAAERA